MSILSEITRLSGAKSDIADAIEYKGVTVPDSTKLDGYAALIRQIQGGGVTVVETTDENGGTVVEITSTTDPIRFQEKSATPTTSSQTVSPDTGYNGLSRVVVNPIPSQYIIPTGTRTITENGTGINVAQYAAVDVSVSGGTDFIIQFSKNTTTGYWEPDKTFAEVYAAYQDGKTISGVGTSLTGPVSVTITQIDSQTYLYVVLEPINGQGNDFCYKEMYFGVNSSDVVGLSDTYYDYDTSNADATASDVLSGKVFYTSTGKSTGSIQAKTSSDLTASGATVTAPAGYYASDASASVASGTAGTPTATKGSVSNHSVTVTPSVTNTTGYITGSTINGTGVSVSASELVSGTRSITSNGTGIDVTNYAAVDVSVPTGTARTSADLTVSGATVMVPAGLYASDASASVASGGEGIPTAAKGSVSDHTVMITPSVTNTPGYIRGSTISGTGVTVSASELVSGTLSITSDGTGIDVTNYAEVDVSTDFVVTFAYNSQTDMWEPDCTLTELDDARYAGKTIYATLYGGSGFYYFGWLGYNSSVQGYEIGIYSNYDEHAWAYIWNYNGYVCDGEWGYSEGSEGTPVATKGAVSNHSISVTPSVTNTEGYIMGGTHTGTAVTVSASELVSGTKSISANGTGIDVTNYASVDVSVTPSLEAKTGITPTESSQTISPSTGYDGLSSVQIDAVSSTYVGSGITRRSSTDLTASGATVSVPAGYYSSAASKSVSSGSATTPATTVTANPSISVNSSGLITATASATQSVTPTVSAGYVSSGTAGTITVSGSNTSQLSTQAATTITPTKSSQTAVTAGKYTTGAVTVAAIPAAYQDVTGVTATASDVVSGKDFVNSSGTVVHGSLVIQHYYTGSGAPSSSLGVNGDIYLQTS